MAVNWSIFDIVGPVMIGPSSSHTAGACRLGLMVNRIFGLPDYVNIHLHGSFAKVYKGHGTDKALVGGILGMDSDDERLVDSFNIAQEKGLEFQFTKGDLGSKYHSNTVKFTVRKNNQLHTIIGSSIGGGNIKIVSIDNVMVDKLDGSKDFTIVGGISIEYVDELKSLIDGYEYKFYKMDKEALVLILDRVSHSFLDQLRKKFVQERNFWSNTVLALK